MARQRGRPGKPHRTVTDKALRKDILVFVEGAKTEEEYLLYWHRLNRLRINVQLSPTNGTPKTLVDLAAKEKKRAERQAKQGRPFDEVWCVFDVDEHPQLADAVTKAEANGIHLAVSNPCIELWFLLHFREQTAWIDRGDAQSAAKDFLGPGKCLSDAALRLLEEHYEVARGRAQALDVKHSGDGSPPGSNPSSRAWQLVETIVTA